MAEKEKQLNGRIIHKHDTEVNWLKAIGFTPKQSELIVYDIDENYNYQRIKIGDGIHNVNELPFYAGSWNDLKDKPYGEEITLGDTLLEEQFFEIGGGQFQFVHISNTSLNLVEGQTYIVTFNGEQCSCIAWYHDYSGGIAIGDGFYLGMGDKGENVAFAFLDYYGCYLYGSSGTYSIKTEGSVLVNKIDPKYLPDNIGAQSDWDETDETSTSYIKNRPFYINKSAITEIFNVAAYMAENSLEWETQVQIDDTYAVVAVQLPITIPAVEGEDYTFIVDGVEYVYTAQYTTQNGTPGFTFGKVPTDMSNFIFYAATVPAMNMSMIMCRCKASALPTECRIVGSLYEIKKLDEKYIPDTIARKADIPEQVQPDWDETDETSPSYIRNKPDENDALLLVTEMGLVQPVSTASGDILTDNNNNIIIL